MWSRIQVLYEQVNKRNLHLKWCISLYSKRCRYVLSNDLPVGDPLSETPPRVANGGYLPG